MFFFEDRILQGNAYKDPVLFEVFHIFIVVFRCPHSFKKKRNFLVKCSTLEVPLYVKNYIYILKTLLNSVRIGFKFVVCSLCMSEELLVWISCINS